MEELLYINKANEQLRQIIEEILHLYQQNTSCKELCEKKSEDLQNQKIEILKKLDLLKTLCMINHSQVKNKLEVIKDMCSHMNENQIHMCRKLEELNKEYELLDRQYKEQENNFKKSKNTCMIAEKQQAVAEQSSETLRKQIKKQKDELKKFFWIPYNINYFDIQLKDALSQVEHAKQYYKQACEQREMIERSLQAMKQHREIFIFDQDKFQRHYEQLQYQLKKSEEQMQILKKDVVQWELILNSTNIIYNQVETVNVVLEELIVMQNELINLA